VANRPAADDSQRAWLPNESLREVLESIKKEWGVTVSPRERLVRRIVPRWLQLRVAVRDLQRGDPQLRDRGLRSLYILQDARASKPLMAVLQGEPRRWHNRVAEMLVRLGDVAIDEIDRSLESLHPDTQQRLLSCLGYSVSKKAPAVLGRLLRSPESATRLAAAKALERLGTPESRSQLASGAGQGDPAVAEIARASYYRTQPVDVLLADLSIDDWDVREEIGDALVERDPQAVGPLLRAVLHEGDLERRMAAAYALGRLRYRGAASDLLALAAADAEDLDVRELAIEALGQIGDRSVVPALRALMDDPDIRDTVVGSLKKIGSADTESLIADLGSPKVSIRRKAVRALTATGDVRAVRPLLTVMRGDHRVEDRRAAAEAIRRILVATDIGPLAGQSGGADRAAIADDLVQLLDDSDASIRCSLVSVLHKLWCPIVMDAAVRMVSDSDSLVRIRAVNAFSAAGADIRALKTLGQFLAHADVEVRQVATRVIGGIDLAPAVSLLATALGDDHERVRMQAADAFGMNRWAPEVADKVVAALLSALDDASTGVRGRVLAAAVAMTYRYRLRPDVRDALVRRAAVDVRDTDSILVAEAIDALGRLGGDDAIRALAGALEDDRPPVRQRAALALGDVRSASVRQLLTGRLARESDPLARGQLEISIGVHDQREGRD